MRFTIPLLQTIDRKINDMASKMKTHTTCSEDDRFNGSTLTLLTGQHELQKQALGVMTNMKR